MGDFDGDGYDDVMWQNRTTGNVSIWNMGPGGVVTSVSNPIASEQEIAAGTLLHEMDSFHFIDDASDTPPSPLASYDWLG